jgi:NADP-dependent 3-hydroxy acid dehydrogenase YdfG
MGSIVRKRSWPSDYPRISLGQASHAVRQAGFDKGVRATAVCPGFVATDMAAVLSERPAAQMTQPADLARIIAMLLSLPNEASVAEFAINCQLEEFF